jgi:hypothetical protein
MILHIYPLFYKFKAPFAQKAYNLYFLFCLFLLYSFSSLLIHIKFLGNLNSFKASVNSWTPILNPNYHFYINLTIIIHFNHCCIKINCVNLFSEISTSRISPINPLFIHFEALSLSFLSLCCYNFTQAKPLDFEIFLLYLANFSLVFSKFLKYRFYFFQKFYL